jgi:hypothetical protein
MPIASRFHEMTSTSRRTSAPTSTRSAFITCASIASGLFGSPMRLVPVEASPSSVASSRSMMSPAPEPVSNKSR